jgi:hypothetical protein
MPYCNGCGGVFEWGFHDGKWVLLEPAATHDDLDRTYVDENGVLRADHRDRHPRGETVNVERLSNKVKVADVPSEPLTKKERRQFLRRRSVVEA